MRGAVLALVACAACAHVGVRGDPAAAAPIELAYTLELVSAGSGAGSGASVPEVRITVACAGSASGETRFALGESWGGVDHPEAEIHDLVARDDAGHSLRVDHARDTAVWIVTHARGEHVTLSYAVVATQAVEPSTDHRPVVQAGLVHLIGPTVLVYPEPLADGTPHHVRVARVHRGRLAFRIVVRHGCGDRRVARGLRVSRGGVRRRAGPARAPPAGAGWRARGRARQSLRLHR